MKYRLFKQKRAAEPRRLYLLGNPNVGKSTVFNAMTGLRQHTGNWSGKTVDAARGKYTYNNREYELTDLPGTHSVNSGFSEESVAARSTALGGGAVTLILADASALKRGVALALEFLENRDGGAVLCVNFCDIAERRGIKINFDKLSKTLGIPAVGITAKKRGDINRLKELTDKNFDALSKMAAPQKSRSTPEELLKRAAEISDECTMAPKAKNSACCAADRVLTSRVFGIPIMLLFFAGILWLTIEGANYPSELLSRLFAHIKPYIAACVPSPLKGILVDGIYGTVTWIVAVMLPPMAIFFPLFTLLEDAGFLPRIAFNLDRCYARCGMSGKQCLTQCMGLGCNAVGVCGCRIMPDENQRTIAVITNSLIPCNGRFAILISLSAIFIGGMVPDRLAGLMPMLCVLALICLAFAVSWGASLLFSKTLFRGCEAAFAMELPEYRRPEILKTLAVSLVTRTIKIVGRAILVSAPTGAVIWLLANTSVGGAPMLSRLSLLLDPAGRLIGVDGFILLAFILSLPANEITMPILIMGYTAAGAMTDAGSLSNLSALLTQNGWTLLTAVNMMILTLFHWPCATTLITIYKETKSLKTLALSFLTPCVIGVTLCLITKLLANAVFLIV